MRENLYFYKCYHSSDIIKPKKQIRKNQHYVVPPNKKKMVFTDICEHLHIQIPITNTDNNSPSEFEIYRISISTTEPNSNSWYDIRNPSYISVPTTSMNSTSRYDIYYIEPIRTKTESKLL